MAAKKMVDDIAAEQINTVKHAATFIDSLAHYLEPGSQCDADKLLACLQKAGVKGDAMNIHQDVLATLKSQCAKDNGCTYDRSSESKHMKSMEHETEALKKETMKFAMEVHTTY